jgi:hypothetical protein
MSDQYYAPPKSDLKSLSTEIQSLIKPLLATKPWARLCSIIGFIGSVFMVLAGLGMMLGGVAMGQNSPFGRGLGAGMGLVYILLSLLYFFPSLFLFKYASKIGVASSTQSAADIVSALEQQKLFWKFAGILVSIMIIFMLIGIASAILIPIIMR